MPAPSVSPLAAQVIKEAGVDIGKARSKLLTPKMLNAADKVITMGCVVDDVCPGALVETEDWGIDDPVSPSKSFGARDLIKKEWESWSKNVPPCFFNNYGVLTPMEFMNFKPV